MEFSHEIDKHIKEKFDHIVRNSLINDDERDELILLINMAHSSGHVKGSKNANVLAKKIGNWSNNN